MLLVSMRWCLLNNIRGLVDWASEMYSLLRGNRLDKGFANWDLRAEFGVGECWKYPVGCSWDENYGDMMLLAKKTEAWPVERNRCVPSYVEEVLVIDLCVKNCRLIRSLINLVLVCVDQTELYQCGKNITMVFD